MDRRLTLCDIWLRLRRRLMPDDDERAVWLPLLFFLLLWMRRSACSSGSKSFFKCSGTVYLNAVHVCDQCVHR